MPHAPESKVQAGAAKHQLDPLGLRRVLTSPGAQDQPQVLPQQAQSLNVDLPLGADELRIEVEALNIDSASFHQIATSCQGDESRIAARILEIITQRGKMHNPVTGSGGMLIGRVAEVGAAWPTDAKPVRVGDRIATLVSLSLTPLKLRQLKKIHLGRDRVDVEADAILFSSGLFARLPSDLPESVALAVLDVAGAPAQTRQLVKPNDVVVVIGGGGKSGALCLYEAKRKAGVKTIAIDYSDAAIERLKKFTFVDEVIQTDARNAVQVMSQIRALTSGKMADVVINVANIANTEMASILSCRQRGIVYLFSMATSFTAAALGAEGVGADVDLRIGNGYTQGHADLSLELLRESAELRMLFTETYA